MVQGRREITENSRGEETESSEQAKQQAQRPETVELEPGSRTGRAEATGGREEEEEES